MTDDTIISVRNLTKKYNLYNHPLDMLKETFHPLRKKYHRDFYALTDVSFDIKRGETVGIIGKNGAGKSTLLKILTGVVSPTSGSVDVRGRISSLLELGAGFNPEMTGVENVYMNGTIMGYSQADMDKRIDSILEFADIGEFVYQPVKMYSSGMFARLAFAVAINVDPEILIVDEALSVGDVRFQQKCYRKFRDLKEMGTTVLFVTHDTGTVINFCSQTIWIHGGRKHDEGAPDVVCKRYLAAMAYEHETDRGEQADAENGVQSEVWVDTAGFESFGDKKVVITGVMLGDENNMPLTVFAGGEDVTVKVRMRASEDIESIICGFVVTDSLGNAIFGANTYAHSELRPDFKSGGEYITAFRFAMPLLKNGSFSLSVAVAEGTQATHIQHHWIHDVLSFRIATTDITATLGQMLRDVGYDISVDEQ